MHARQQLLAWILVFGFSSPAYSQVPDGEVAVNEGVCDELMYSATKGLYGLCVAFCEAQDCEADFSLDDPFAVCKASSTQILEKYYRLKSESDPDMPCVQQGACPCWSDAEIHLMRYPDPSADEISICSTGYVIPTAIVEAWTVLGLAAYPSEYQTFMAVRKTFIGSNSEQRSCGMGDTCIRGDCLNYTRNFIVVTDEQYDSCLVDVIAAGQARGYDCWD